MKVHYLEIVTLDIDTACLAYESTHKITFGTPEALLGGARTSTLADGSIIGIRAPMHSSEQPVVRPYWLVNNVQAALDIMVSQGAEIAHPPLEIPGKGVFAIYILDNLQQGLWQI